MDAPEEDIRQIKCETEDSIERLSVGEVVYYAFSRHGSVGVDAEFEIENDEVLSHERSETEYIHIEKMKKPEWTGGDAERGKWFFKACRPGTSRLTVRKLFRFEVESECTVKIVVE
ncbi:MAG: hypothetical protein ACXAAO_12710 [Candidatus Thorarchaeota archaeon]|jgi:hypothetical protein